MKKLLFLLCFTLSACASTSNTNLTQRPNWIDNPDNGVSASAGTHIKGKVAQEELAISRARVEFAKRYGVSIDAAQVTETHVANGRGNTTSNSLTHEETKQTDVKAMVKAKWLDTDRDVLWVWLVPAI